MHSRGSLSLTQSSYFPKSTQTRNEWQNCIVTKPTFARLLNELPSASEDEFRLLSFGGTILHIHKWQQEVQYRDKERRSIVIGKMINKSNTKVHAQDVIKMTLRDPA